MAGLSSGQPSYNCYIVFQSSDSLQFIYLLKVAFDFFF